MTRWFRLKSTAWQQRKSPSQIVGLDGWIVKTLIGFCEARWTTPTTIPIGAPIQSQMETGGQVNRCTHVPLSALASKAVSPIPIPESRPPWTPGCADPAATDASRTGHRPSPRAHVEAAQREAARRTSPPGMGNPIPPATRPPPPPLRHWLHYSPNPESNEAAEESRAPQTNKNPTRFQLAERAAESQSSRFLPLPRFASLASIRFDSGVGAQGGRGNRPAPPRPAPLVLYLSVHFHPAGRLAGSGRGSFLRSRVFLSVALDLWLGSPPAPFRETSLGAECVICLYYFFVFPLLARAVDLLLAPGSVGLVCLEFVRVWAFRSCRPGLVWARLFVCFFSKQSVWFRSSVSFVAGMPVFAACFTDLVQDTWVIRIFFHLSVLCCYGVYEFVFEVLLLLNGSSRCCSSCAGSDAAGGVAPVAPEGHRFLLNVR